MSLALQEGTVFAGRYRVIRCIAKGGMGAVYEVTHIETDRRRALKVMLPQMLHSDELKERFKREARVAAQIDSEFIVDVFDAGVDEPTQAPFLVMELLKGEELGQRLARLGPMSPADVVTNLYQAALALDKTHKASIVHRDLKPENLFLTQREHGEPRIKVLDFGIAKFVTEQGTQANATRSLGTPLYMSPEQFRSGKISPAVDMYALGMMAYTLLVGEHYWERESRSAGSVFAFAVIAMEGPQEPATDRAAGRNGVTLPPAFNAWFLKATSPDPGQRFPTATSTISALSDALGLGLGPLTAGALPTGSGPFTFPTGAVTLPVGKAVALATGSAALGPREATGAPRRKNGPALLVALLACAVVVAGLALFFLKAQKPPAPADAGLSTSTTSTTLTTSTAASAMPAALPSAAPIDSGTAKVEAAPEGFAIATAKPTTSTAGKPSSAPRKPAPSAAPRATGKPVDTEPVYTRD